MRNQPAIPHGHKAIMVPPVMIKPDFGKNSIAAQDFSLIQGHGLEPDVRDVVPKDTPGIETASPEAGIRAELLDSRSSPDVQVFGLEDTVFAEGIGYTRQREMISGMCVLRKAIPYEFARAELPIFHDRLSLPHRNKNETRSSMR
jgi:hypothetical protein